MNTKTIVKVGTAFAAAAALVCTAAAQTGNTDFTVPLTGLTSSQKTLDMVFVEGGTYNRGCSEGDNKCVEGEKPVHKVTLSNYYIGKYELTNAQWKAVMGDGTADNKPKTNITWYDAVEFTCKLREKTGIRYRLATDAEFEYAARGGKKTHGYLYSGSNTPGDVAWTSETSGGGYGAKDVGGKAANELGIYDMSGNVYEWTLDSWQSTYSSGDKTDPSYRPAAHTQKTRRGGSYDQVASESRVSARKIRSIEGKDGSIGLRLALSASDAAPAAQIDPCGISQPFPTGAKIGYRDERIATADDEAWIYDMSDYNPGMGYVLRLSANGAAKYAMIMKYNGQQFTTEQASGEWFTVNGQSLYIVPSSGAAKQYIYLPLCRAVCDNMSMMPSTDMPGRYERMKLTDFPGASGVALPNIGSPKTPEALAQAAGKTNTDMSNPPKTGHDARLIEGTSQAWVQDNVAMGAGGTHRYRKDFDSNSDMRFVVWDAQANSSTLLAHGPWFTVDNTFLRVNDPNGATYDYLYSVVGDTVFYHISFQSYEPGDFRMLKKMNASSVPQWKEPTSNTTYNQGASKYIPPSETGTSAPGYPTSIAARSVSAKSAPMTLTGRTLSVNIPAGSMASVRVVNLTGKTVASFTASGAANLSLRKIPAGAYLIEARIDGRAITRSAVLR